MELYKPIQHYIDQEKDFQFPNGFIIASKAAMRMAVAGRKKTGKLNMGGFQAIVTFNRKYFKNLTPKEADQLTVDLWTENDILIPGVNL